MSKFFIREYREEDLPALAIHWKESIKGWPPGFESGAGDWSPEAVREWLTREKHLKFWIGWVDDVIVSHITYNRHYQEENVTYIGLFNAHPDHHGKSYGRKLLVAAVEKAVEDKVNRLDLHTWSANLKAVPLYKKCGFFWRPRTEVHMYNFLPAALNHAFVKEFLGESNWYESLRQSLEIEESSETFAGCHYHKYTFEKDGKRIEVLIDPSTSGVAGFTSDDLTIRCDIPDETHIAGLPHPVKWTFLSKRDKPVKVKVSCKPEDGLEYSFDQEFELKGERIFETVAEPGADVIPEKIDWQGKAIECRVEIDGLEAVFSPGLRAVPPFEMDSEPYPIRLMPGETRDIVINLKSRMAEKASFSPVLKVSGDVTSAEKPSLETISLPAHGSFGLGVNLAASVKGREGVIEIGGCLKAGDSETDIHPMKAHVGIAPPGKPIEIPDEKPEVITVSNGFISMKAEVEGGKVESYHAKMGYLALYLGSDAIGEPFSDEFWSKKYDVSFESGEYSGDLVFKVESTDFPGIRLERRITLGTGTEFGISWKITNSGKKEFAGQLQLRPSVGGASFGVAPIDGMLVKGSKENWTNCNLPLPTDPARFSERWIAWYRSKSPTTEIDVIGLIFKGASHLGYSWSSHPFVEYTIDTLAPGETTTLPTLRILPDAGSWQNVQRAALEGEPSSLPTEPRHFMHAESPIFADDTRPQFTFRMVRSAPCEGYASITLPDGRTEEVTAEKWNLDAPMVLRTPELDSEKCGLMLVDYKLRAMFLEKEGKLPLVVPVPGSSIEIKKGREGDYDFYSVDNGSIEFRVAPEFCGSLFKLVEKSAREKNLLRTSWPKPGMWTWFNPWFGGIKLYPGRWDHSYHKSEFTGDIVSMHWAGHDWKGIRVSIRAPRAQESLLMESIFLTKPGIPAVLNLHRFTETAGRSQRLNIETMAFPVPSGDPEAKVEGIVDEIGAGIKVSTSEGGTGAGTGTWAAVYDPETGKTLGTVMGRGVCTIWDAANEGQAVWMTANIHTDPERTAELAVLYVIAECPELIQPLAESFRSLDMLLAQGHPERIDE